MVTKLISPQDRIKLVHQVDELKDKMKVGEAMKKLGEGGRDRYFEARKWLWQEGYIGEDMQWTDKARPFLEILTPIIGPSRTSPAAPPAPAARAPVQNLQQVPASGHEEKAGRQYKYEGRAGKARIFVTVSDKVMNYILARHERSGIPIATIAADLLFKGYELETSR